MSIYEVIKEFAQYLYPQAANFLVLKFHGSIINEETGRKYEQPHAVLVEKGEPKVLVTADSLDQLEKRLKHLVAVAILEDTESYNKAVEKSKKDEMKWKRLHQNAENYNERLTALVEAYGKDRRRDFEELKKILRGEDDLAVERGEVGPKE